ncbi:MAG: hypothetical protein NTZ46_09650 [Verrucomicrobia bacterium]|nr:hypothetical protein [Verrucomicrobiota bacterium]
MIWIQNTESDIFRQGMNMAVSPQLLESSISRWKRHEFFNSAVVLGLDIGLEGIGVCVRRGREIVYAKTWQYDVPEAARLESRRQMRAARHCRANRKTRLHRLKKLFEKHGLPWVDEKSETSLHTDPFILRHRAVRPTGRGLASKEALSLAIRHCVSHRGYDYEYFNDEGAYPWGDSIEFKKVLKELSTIWLTAEDASNARCEAVSFEWSDEQMAEFDKMLTARTGGPDIIEKRLSQHAKGEQNHRRIPAKGEAFPRKFVWQHLEQIIKRHEHLINDPQVFLSALAINPKNGGNKEEAIFYYHRKTPAEMREHFEKKRARCPYSEWLGIGSFFVEKRGHQSIRRFSLLEFATTRDIQLTDGRKVPVGEKMTKRFLEWVSTNPEARTKKEAKPIIDELIDALKKEHNAKPAPNTKSPLNKSYFETLRDLLAPSVANRRKNGVMSSAAADHLYTVATANGFSREAVNSALKDCQPTSGTRFKSLYDFRRSPTSDVYGVYPQVEFLLGQRVKKDRKPSSGRKLRGTLAHDGKLQRLFKELAPQLNGKLAPDYCVVETARDLPHNLKQKQEIEAEQKKRREEREKLFAKFGVTDKGKRNKRLRIKLYSQQDGVCPFSGEKLGDDPLSGMLDIEHLYPESRGGLTVDENLVLTFEKINRSEKKNRTPREYAATGAHPFEEMLKLTAKMRWSQFKREVFAWNKPDDIPPFGNVTRTAQLAKQLHAELTRWMAIEGDSNRIAERLGTPSGFQTAACRRAWQLPEKDRNDLTHHLVDAAILAHIPPREGQNFARYGGIFFPRWIPEKKRVVLDVLPSLGPDPQQIGVLTAPDAPECPILRHRSRSTSRQMNYTTLLGLGERRQLSYRKPLDKASFKGDAVQLEKELNRLGFSPSRCPKREELNRWLNSESKNTLILRDGTPVSAILADSDKFHTPFGFTAQINSNGEWQGIKIFRERFDALEIWAGTDAKNRLVYFSQRRPSETAMRALLQLGFRWFQWASRQPEWNHLSTDPKVKKVASALRRYNLHRKKHSWMLSRPKAKEILKALVYLGFDLAGESPECRWNQFQEIIWGKNTAKNIHRVRMEGDQGQKKWAEFQKGDSFLISFDQSGEISSDPRLTVTRRWFSVSAINTSGKVEFSMLLEKPIKDTDGKRARKNIDGIPYSFEKSAPKELASIIGLPAPDDSSPYPNQRATGPARPSGEVDFRLK